MREGGEEVIVSCINQQCKYACPDLPYKSNKIATHQSFFRASER